MIHYADGTEARVGDHVEVDGQPAIVEAVITGDADQDNWGLEEPGLMFRMDLTLHVPDERGNWIEQTFHDDLVFYSSDSESWGSVVFLRRKDN
jgi:hypothetical protein